MLPRAGAPIRIGTAVFYGKSFRIIGRTGNDEEGALDIARMRTDLPAAGAQAAFTLCQGLTPCFCPG